MVIDPQSVICYTRENNIDYGGLILKTKKFIESAIKVHGNKYSYDNTIYIKSKEKVIITCPKHGDFLQEPRCHISMRQGCSKCRYDKLSKKNSLSNEEFIKKSIEIHGNTYDYSKTKYVNDKTKVIIICKIHGDFLQRGGGHLQGKGCKKCASSKISNILASTSEEFIKKSIEVHGDKYDYSLVDYKSTHENVKIICKKHGVFEQMPSNHIRGWNCPNCSNIRSVGEIELLDWLKSLNVNVEHGNRKIIYPKEIDIYLKDFKLGIEYNGVYWHSEKWGKSINYHSEKTDACSKSGIHLMQFWDIEWKNKKDIVKSIILNKIGIHSKKYYARKLSMKVVDVRESRKFCEENHLHGFRGGVLHNGLYDGEELVALMITAKDGEMVRFVVKCNCSVIGGFTKLLKYSGVKYSFVDKRIFTGYGYFSNGFKYEYTTNPNYFYINNGNRMESRHKYQKHKLSKILNSFNNELTEVENMKNNGYYRIFDCGHLKFTIGDNNGRY